MLELGRRSNKFLRIMKTLLIPILTAASMILAPELLAAAPDAGASKPNVVFIIADDLGRELGCYGDRTARTPNIDRLAASGVLFARAYGQGAVCTPSRNSFLTGLSTRTVGIHTKFSEYAKRDPEATSLGRHFRRNGYQTAGFGKIAHTLEHEDPEAWDVREQPKEKGLLKAREERKDQRPGGAYRNITQIYGDDSKTLDAIQADCFEDFLINKRVPGKPFLAAVGFHSPHEPHMVYQRNLNAFALADMPLLRQPEGASPYNPLAFNFLPWYPDDNTQRALIRSYYAAVNQLDEQVGRILQMLDKQGLAENTIVLFIGDNGYNHGFRGQWAKHHVYPDVIHQPLLVRAPGITKGGGVTQGLVEYLDIFPTLVDLCGLPPVAGRDGKSFAAQLRNTDAPGKTAAYVEWAVPAENVKNIIENLPADPAHPVLPLPNGVSTGYARAVYTKDWCYVEYYGTAIRELYRLNDDAHGYFNLAERHPEVVASHAELLHNYFPLNSGGKMP